MAECVFSGLNPIALGLCVEETIAWGPVAYAYFLACFGNAPARKLKRDEISAPIVAKGEEYQAGDKVKRRAELAAKDGIRAAEDGLKSEKVKRAGGEIRDKGQAQSVVDIFHRTDKKCFPPCEDCHKARKGDPLWYDKNADPDRSATKDKGVANPPKTS